MKTIKLTSLICLLSIITFAQSSHIIISQVYGGGGNTGAAYTNDFIELFNPTNTDVDLNGWSVQYSPAASVAYVSTPLTGIIKAGHYYLIKEYSSGTNGNTLPAADDSGNINLGATAGKVVLYADTQHITMDCPLATLMFDFLGYGSSASCSETSPASAPSNSKALVRKDAGCTDNNNNATDFETNVPMPHNSTSPTWSCTTGIAETEAPFISIYPNPCVDKLFIKNSKQVTVKIINITGQTVIANEAKPSPCIDVSHLPSGVYFILAQAGNNVYSEKFIK